MEMKSLSASERILLAEALWDSVIAEGAEIAVTQAQKSELERRLAAFEIDRDAGSPWSEVKLRILSKK